jgi:hypothetical protein
MSSQEFNLPLLIVNKLLYQLDLSFGILNMICFTCLCFSFVVSVVSIDKSSSLRLHILFSENSAFGIRNSLDSLHSEEGYALEERVTLEALLVANSK